MTATTGAGLGSAAIGAGSASAAPIGSCFDLRCDGGQLGRRGVRMPALGRDYGARDRGFRGERCRSRGHADDLRHVRDDRIDLRRSHIGVARLNRRADIAGLTGSVGANAVSRTGSAGFGVAGAASGADDCLWAVLWAVGRRRRPCVDARRPRPATAARARWFARAPSRPTSALTHRLIFPGRATRLRRTVARPCRASPSRSRSEARALGGRAGKSRSCRASGAAGAGEATGGTGRGPRPAPRSRGGCRGETTTRRQRLGRLVAPDHRKTERTGRNRRSRDGNVHNSRLRHHDPFTSRTRPTLAAILMSQEKKPRNLRFQLHFSFPHVAEIFDLRAP